MIRIFSLLAALAILMALAAGIGTYWVSLTDINQARQKATESMAQGLALSVSAQIATLQQTVSKMAVTTEVIEAIETKNSQQMAATASILEQFLPNVMKIRILPANVTHLDESSIPHMGNADLLMAQETLTKTQLPVLQGQGENRHLAITAAVIKNNQPIGIILASLKYDFLQTILNTTQAPTTLLELKQQNTILAKTGRSPEDAQSSKHVKVAKTSWNISYSPAPEMELFSNLTVSSFITIPALLIGIGFFIAYRNTTHLLRQDQGTILKAIKDLLSNKTIGSYPIKLGEMKTLISAMVQFKRFLDSGGSGHDFASDLEGGKTEIDDFFDESDGISFLDMDFSDTAEESTIQTPSKPISLPETEPLDKPEPNIVEPSILDAPPVKTAVSTIFRSYDIRGIAEESITEEIVFNIGKAVASEAKEKNIGTIVVGRDGRLSSPAFAESLSQGIISTGLNVLDIGLVPSPLVYFVAQHTEGKSAIVVTASHNPAEYNGLKIIIDGESLADERIQQIKQRVDDENYATGTPGTIDKNDMFTNEYIGIIAEDIHLVRPMKVVVDCGNGAAGEIAPILLKTLGCEVFELFCDIDGTFPNHHPDPTNPDNLQNLIAGVEHYEADIGIAFDGDGDRIGVVDSKGKIIWPDRLLMLFAEEVLAQKPGADIIFDMKCSRHLKEFISKHGGRPVMWKTGHSLMKTKLKESGAVLAGEMSGHIFFNDRWFGFDDALYSAARLIGILSADKRSSDYVFADLPESPSTPEINIELAEGENIILMEQLLAKANFADAEIITIDGMRVEFADGWGLLRASNTMPALALRFEADSDDALSRIQSQFKDLLTEIKPDINIPF